MFTKKQDRGNALFLILIAVALFAALSYAVTQSGRGESGIDREQAAIAAAQIVQYFSQIEQSIQRLKLINRCTVQTLSMHYDSDGDGVLETDGSDDYYNPNSPSDFSCHVFQPNGGGLTYQVPQNEWLDTSFSSEANFGEITFNTINSLTNRGTSLAETISFIPYVNRNICIALNNGVNTPNPSGSPPDEGSSVGVQARPIHEVSSGSTGLDVPDAPLSGCFEGGTLPAEGFHVYHMLFAN